MSSNSTSLNGVAVAIRAIVFIICAAALFVYLNLAFVMKGTPQNKGAYDAFYDLPENSVDVMYLGTSATSRFYVNPKAFNDLGIASFSLGAQNTPAYFIKSLIQEVELTQHPQLYVIELRVMRKEPGSISEGFVRTTLDSMNYFSPYRPAMAKEAIRYCTDNGSTLFDYYVPISKYHGRLLEGDMTSKDFMLETPYNYTQGFYPSKLALSQTPQKRAVFVEEDGELDKSSEAVLEDLFSFCNEFDRDILFVLAPCSTSKEMSKSMNATASFVQSHGFKVLNCNTYEICEQMGLDWKTDFYNDHHVNYLGAEKYTDFFANYLASHYSLPDRRGDTRYQSWIDGYKYYKDYVSRGILYSDSGEEGEE